MLTPQTSRQFLYVGRPVAARTCWPFSGEPVTQQAISQVHIDAKVLGHPRTDPSGDPPSARRLEGHKAYSSWHPQRAEWMHSHVCGLHLWSAESRSYLREVSETLQKLAVAAGSTSKGVWPARPRYIAAAKLYQQLATKALPAAQYDLFQGIAILSACSSLQVLSAPLCCNTATSRKLCKQVLLFRSAAQVQ